MRRALALASAALFITPAFARAGTVEWTLTNHGRDYHDELVRLGVAPKAPWDSTRLEVHEDGKPVPCQVEVRDGTPERVLKGDIWVLTTIASGTSHSYTVTAGGRPAKTEPRVKVSESDHFIIMDNGLVSVTLRKRVRRTTPSGIIEDFGWSRRGGASRLAGGWRTKLPFKSVTYGVPGDGALFGKVRLRYEFEGGVGLGGDVPAHAEFTFTMMPGQPVVHVEESHEMGPDDSWMLHVSSGWKPTKGLIRRWYKGQHQADEALREVGLVPGQTRMGETLLNLQPRWTQSYDEGWFFGATDGSTMVGAVAAKAGRWRWPHDNLIKVKLRAGGGYAGLECPTYRGSRYWLLVAGDRRLADDLNDLVTRTCFEPLDKLAHEYILDWPGKPAGGFRGRFFYSNQTNPTDVLRRWGRAAIREAAEGRIAASRETLSEVQVYLDPDHYGSYWDFWSPINPNFYTDFIKYPVAKATALKSHPEFGRIRALVEDAVRTDLWHSVTLPGGAGQECPGYVEHSMQQWKALAPLCKEHLGFDITTWPRYRAGASFELHVSQPAGGGKRVFHPGGDTHPKRPDPEALAREFGAWEDPKRLVTEELPGFGVVFRNACGTDRETYLAFKSGPNRGHYHGDQLSFHYCADAKPVAVDHHSSYHKRAGQEHMHNRVAFGTDDWPYWNMDGHERVIAFKTSPVADVAVGQVESPRLRKQKRLPPEDWDATGPLREVAVTYRRTVVLVKRGRGGRGVPGEDYLVIRDEHRSAEPLTATYCLHVLGERAERTGRRIEFDRLTLFCGSPERFGFENLPWSHDVGGEESTQGARLSQKGRRTEFVTVLYPGRSPPKMRAVPDGVRVGTDEIRFGRPFPEEGRKGDHVTVTRRGATVLSLGQGEIDLYRSQGEVGLFVPDVGYPFGPVPDWLVRQRTQVPEWHTRLMEERWGPDRRGRTR